MIIKIFAGGFYPQIHPRAFRAYELAKEFVRQGHEVEVINMTTIDGFDYNDFSNKTKIAVINLGINHMGEDNKLHRKSNMSNSIVRKYMTKVAQYLMHGSFFKQSRIIIPKLSCVKGADIVIALSTPFVCLYTLSRFIKENGKNFLAIADSGDPFYYSKQTKRALWFKYIEKSVYKQFDYLTIPTANAIPLYKKLIPVDKIRIIPQGFDMRNLKLYKGELSEKLKFAYAGVFYWDIRNPEFLLRYLDALSLDYEFHIFMRYEDLTFNEALQKYKSVAKKIVVNYNVPHDDLIYELSKMHFLINIENISSTQMPSKLIDYGMSGRPIFSCKSSTFSEIKFNNFISGNYEGAYKVNLEDYNIENIVKKIFELEK